MPALVIKLCNQKPERCEILQITETTLLLY